MLVTQILLYEPVKVYQVRVKVTGTSRKIELTKRHERFGLTRSNGIQEGIRGSL